MKVSSILVISVIIKLQQIVVSRHIFSLFMKESSIYVMNVIIKRYGRLILKNTKKQGTCKFRSNSSDIINAFVCFELLNKENKLF